MADDTTHLEDGSGVSEIDNNDVPFGRSNNHEWVCYIHGIASFRQVDTSDRT